MGNDFVSKLDAAVREVKENEDIKQEYIRYQLNLMASSLIGQAREKISIAKRMILRDKSFEEISKFTDIPITKLEVIAKKIANGERF